MMADMPVFVETVYEYLCLCVFVYGEQLLFVDFYFRAFLHIGLLSHAYFRSLLETSFRNCPYAHLTQEV